MTQSQFVTMMVKFRWVKSRLLLKMLTLSKSEVNVGMVFQRPNPFPKSIYDNVGYGVRLHTKPSREELDAIVEKSLKVCSDMG